MKVNLIRTAFLSAVIGGFLIALISLDQGIGQAIGIGQVVVNALFGLVLCGLSAAIGGLIDNAIESIKSNFSSGDTRRDGRGRFERQGSRAHRRVNRHGDRD